MIRFRTFGAPDLRGEEASELRGVLTQPRLLALLVYLTLARPRGFHRRDSLVALFWPDANQEQARNALRQVVHRLRRALGEGVVVNRGAEELGIDPARIWCDAVAFEGTVDAGDLPAALELCRGDLLPGFYVSEAPDFERWLEGERVRLRQEAARAGWELAEREAGAGRDAAAGHCARWAAALTPDDEDVLRRLIQLLIRLGDRSGALRAYDAFARRLAEDLEVTPSPETRALVVPLRDAALAAALGEAEPRRSPAPTSPPTVAADSKPDTTAPVAPASSPAKATRRRRSIAFGIGAGLFALGSVVVWYGRPREAPRPALKAVAVFPFAVRGSSDLAYLREGMMDLLSAKLEDASGIHAIDPRSVIAAVEGQGATPTPSGGFATIARRLGADWYISGDVVEIAGRIQLSAALYPVGADARPAAASVEGETNSLFQLVDDLTGQVLAHLSLGRDTAVTRLAALTTHSLPALKAFLQGEQALRAGLDAQAAAAFREAATLDTGFALAQYRLALSATWVMVTDVENPGAWAATAARHAQRLTPLVRDLLTAYSAYKAVDAAKAERLYLSLTEGYPDNVEAWFMLGETRFHYGPITGRSPGESRPAFERVLALDPGNAHAMIHLARLAAAEGRTADLDSLARRYLERYREAERTLEMRALQAFLRDQPAAWTSIATMAQATGPLVTLSVLEDAFAYAQNLDAARALAPALKSVSEPVSLRLGQRMLSDLGLGGGQWGRETAVRLLGSGVDDDWLFESEILMAADPFFPVPRTTVAALRDRLAARSRFTFAAHPAIQPDEELGARLQMYFLGLLSVRLGEAAAADRYASELAAVRAGRSAGSAASLAHALRAEIARTRGDPRQALAELERFDFEGIPSMLGNVLHWGIRERFLRAELLHALGSDREALPWYDSFHVAYDLVYMAAAHLRSGEIEQRLANVERARFHLTRLVNLWKDCDPEFRPLLDQATHALAKLGGEPTR